MLSAEEYPEDPKRFRSNTALMIQVEELRDIAKELSIPLPRKPARILVQDTRRAPHLREWRAQYRELRTKILKAQRTTPPQLTVFTPAPAPAADYRRGDFQTMMAQNYPKDPTELTDSALQIKVQKLNQKLRELTGRSIILDSSIASDNRDVWERDYKQLRQSIFSRRTLETAARRRGSMATRRASSLAARAVQLNPTEQRRVEQQLKLTRTAMGRATTAEAMADKLVMQQINAYRHSKGSQQIAEATLCDIFSNDTYKEKYLAARKAVISLWQEAIIEYEKPDYSGSDIDFFSALFSSSTETTGTDSELIRTHTGGHYGLAKRYMQAKIVKLRALIAIKLPEWRTVDWHTATATIPETIAEIERNIARIMNPLARGVMRLLAEQNKILDDLFSRLQRPHRSPVDAHVRAALEESTRAAVTNREARRLAERQLAQTRRALEEARRQSTVLQQENMALRQELNQLIESIATGEAKATEADGQINPLLQRPTALNAIQSRIRTLRAAPGDHSDEITRLRGLQRIIARHNRAGAAKLTGGGGGGGYGSTGQAATADYTDEEESSASDSSDDGRTPRPAGRRRPASSMGVQSATQRARRRPRCKKITLYLLAGLGLFVVACATAGTLAATGALSRSDTPKPPPTPPGFSPYFTDLWDNTTALALPDVTGEMTPGSTLLLTGLQPSNVTYVDASLILVSYSAEGTRLSPNVGVAIEQFQQALTDVRFAPRSHVAPVNAVASAPFLIDYPDGLPLEIKLLSQEGTVEAIKQVHFEPAPTAPFLSVVPQRFGPSPSTTTFHAFSDITLEDPDYSEGARLTVHFPTMTSTTIDTTAIRAYVRALVAARLAKVTDAGDIDPASLIGFESVAEAETWLTTQGYTQYSPTGEALAAATPYYAMKGWFVDGLVYAEVDASGNVIDSHGFGGNHLLAKQFLLSMQADQSGVLAPGPYVTGDKNLLTHLMLNAALATPKPALAKFGSTVTVSPGARVISLDDQKTAVISGNAFLAVVANAPLQLPYRTTPLNTVAGSGVDYKLFDVSSITGTRFDNVTLTFPTGGSVSTNLTTAGAPNPSVLDASQLFSFDGLTILNGTTIEGVHVTCEAGNCIQLSGKPADIGALLASDHSAMRALAGGGRTGTNTVTYPGISGTYENGDPIVFVLPDGSSHTGTLPAILMEQTVPYIPVSVGTNATLTAGTDRQTYALDWLATATAAGTTPNAFDIYQASVTVTTANGAVTLPSATGTLPDLTKAHTLTPTRALGKTGSSHTVSVKVTLENTSLSPAVVGHLLESSRDFTITVAPNVFTYAGTTPPSGHDSVVSGGKVTPFAHVDFTLAAGETFNAGDELYVRIKEIDPTHTAFSGLTSADPAWTVVEIAGERYLESPKATSAAALTALRDQVRAAELSTGTGPNGIYYASTGLRPELDFSDTLTLWRNAETEAFSPVLSGKSVVVDIPHSLVAADVTAPTVSNVTVSAGGALADAMTGLAVEIPLARRNLHNTYTVVLSAPSGIDYALLASDGWATFSLDDGRPAYMKTVAHSPDELMADLRTNGTLSASASFAASRPGTPYPLMQTGGLAFYETAPGLEPTIAAIQSGQASPLFSVSPGSLSVTVDITPTAASTPAEALALSAGTSVSGTQPWSFCALATENSLDRFRCRIPKNALLTYSDLGVFVDTGSHLEITGQLTVAELNAALSALTVQVTNPFYTAPGTHSLSAGSVEIFRNAEATVALTRSAQTLAVSVSSVPASLNVTIASSITNLNGSTLGKPIFSDVTLGGHPNDTYTVNVTLTGNYTGSAEFPGGTHLPPTTWQFTAASQAAAKAWLEDSFKLLPEPNICDPDAGNCQLVTVTASVASSNGIPALVSTDLSIIEFNDPTTLSVQATTAGTRGSTTSAQAALGLTGSDLDFAHQKFTVELHLDESSGASPYTCTELFPGFEVCSGGSNGAMIVATATGSKQFALEASTRQAVDGAVWNDVVYQISEPASFTETLAALSALQFTWADDGGAHLGESMRGYVVFKDRITGEELARSNSWQGTNSDLDFSSRRLRGTDSARPALVFSDAHHSDASLIMFGKTIQGVPKRDRTTLSRILRPGSPLLENGHHIIRNRLQEIIARVETQGDRIRFQFEAGWSCQRLASAGTTGKMPYSYAAALRGTGRVDGGLSL